MDVCPHDTENGAQRDRDVYELLWDDSRLLWFREEKKQGERKKESKDIDLLVFTKINTEDIPINVNGHQYGGGWNP